MVTILKKESVWEKKSLKTLNERTFAAHNTDIRLKGLHHFAQIPQHYKVLRDFEYPPVVKRNGGFK